MRALIVYESMYGNTRLVAEAIGRGLAPAEVILVPTNQAAGVDLSQVDLLVVGGPTHVHGMSRPSTRQGAIDAAITPQHTLHLEADAAGSGVREWLASLNGLACRAAAFDTRQEGPILLTGRAAKSISKNLLAAGADVIADATSFLVSKSIALVPGEVRRAEAWGTMLRERSAPGPQHPFTGAITTA
ncbi:flavodoxin domain-containing protein [Cryobacterium sp. TMT1-66-1]|uniref:flavodoxin family protein n=1 Tax=Cryobacterium sp. TMT1-66-1 TaxID=1259242 RepID=UPI00106DA33F|nr:flavodoxin domain-containing protein [Cryobacterium sp. TMT1-66-1]TFD07104.1 flavodoxin family protein [Cryobacterium sp. TMT1-66-1]